MKLPPRTYLDAWRYWIYPMFDYPTEVLRFAFWFFVKTILRHHGDLPRSTKTTWKNCKTSQLHLNRKISLGYVSQPSWGPCPHSNASCWPGDLPHVHGQCAAWPAPASQGTPARWRVSSNFFRWPSAGAAAGTPLGGAAGGTPSAGAAAGTSLGGAAGTLATPSPPVVGKPRGAEFVGLLPPEGLTAWEQ